MTDSNFRREIARVRREAFEEAIAVVKSARMVPAEVPIEYAAGYTAGQDYTRTVIEIALDGKRWQAESDEAAA
jgi:hypothetical protein